MTMKIRANYMKISAVCTMLVCLFANANESGPNKLLRCLAQEEAHLHKQKTSGPQYKLNQLFFNEWSGNPDIELLPEVYQRVCGTNANQASISLMREFMLNGVKIFKSYRSVKEDQATSMRLITLQELRRQMPQVFFTYVADLEFFAPTAHCLEKAIPTLAQLREKYRYLESEISIEFMDDYKADWKKVFIALEKWPEHFKKCQDELEKAAKKPAQKQN